MKIILASSNAGKLKEFEKMLKKYEIINFSDIIPSFDIEENGSDFASNALIKARAVYEAIKKQKPEALKNACVLSDDSGISVEALGFAPGIYSARYSSDVVAKPTEASNRAKLKNELEKAGVFSSPAFYTAALALICPFGEYVAHGFMYGEAIAEQRGEHGFGYDFMFIPKGYEHTIGELNGAIKEKISHRSQAVENLKPVLKMLETLIKMKGQ